MSKLLDVDELQNSPGECYLWAKDVAVNVRATPPTRFERKGMRCDTNRKRDDSESARRQFATLLPELAMGRTVFSFLSNQLSLAALSVSTGLNSSRLVNQPLFRPHNVILVRFSSAECVNFLQL